MIVLQSALSAVADRAGAGATPVITLPCPWRVGCSRLHDCPHRSRDRVMGSTQSRDPDMSPNVHQTSHELLREALRGAMGAAVGSERGDGGIGSIPWRASAALDALLGAHPVDLRGRCRSCHGLRALLGRGRRICRVLVVARFYLYQPKDILLGLLASELHQHTTPPTCSRGSAEPLRSVYTAPTVPGRLVSASGQRLPSDGRPALDLPVGVAADAP